MIISIIGVIVPVSYIIYNSGILGQKVKRNEQDIQSIGSKIDKLSEDVASLKACISGNAVDKSQSPLSLTDLQKIEEKGISAKNNLYDIQKACLKVGDDYSKIVSKETFEKIKNYAFQKGQDVQWYKTVFGLLIRDKFFKENNLNISDSKT